MKKKYLIRNIKNLFIVFSITFILWEIVLGIYVHQTDLKIEVPTYTFENTQSFWFDINKDFGTWHLPNHEYRQKKTCFDVVYTSNKNGFRDKNRSLIGSNKRVLVLGDSFIEGVGVDTDMRVSDLLEKETKIPHLNFGMAGNFGPTQYYMLYKTLAQDYAHEAVLIGILPSNDFIDDDYEFNKKTFSDRYKPYFKGEYPEYKLVYYLDSIHKSRVHIQKLKPIKKLFKNFTYSYNLLLYLRTVMRQSSGTVKSLPIDQIPNYFHYTSEQLNRTKYAIDQIKMLAGNRKIMVFTIPTFEEIKEYRKHGKNDLGKEMIAFCKLNGIEYLDLLKASDNLSIEEVEKLFLSCDGHWSERGNAFAKKIIESSFDYYNHD